MKIIRFEIKGEPRGKERPRFNTNTGQIYTPEATADYEDMVRIAYMEASGYRFPDKAQVGMIITAHMAIPKRTSKKRIADMIDKKISPIKRPDLDNIAKIICDSLNGVAYKDDAQVTALMITKSYSSEPKVVVSLFEDTPQCMNISSRKE